MFKRSSENPPSAEELSYTFYHHLKENGPRTSSDLLYELGIANRHRNRAQAALEVGIAAGIIGVNRTLSQPAHGALLASFTPFSPTFRYGLSPESFAVDWYHAISSGEMPESLDLTPASSQPL